MLGFVFFFGFFTNMPLHEFILFSPHGLAASDSAKMGVLQLPGRLL